MLYTLVFNGTQCTLLRFVLRSFLILSTFQDFLFDGGTDEGKPDIHYIDTTHPDILQRGFCE